MQGVTQVWREDVYSLVCTVVSSPTCDLPKNKHQLFQSPLFARTPHCGHFPRFPDIKGIPLLVTGFAASGPTCSGNPVMFLGQKLETDGRWLWRTRAESKKILFKFHSTEGTSDLTPSPWISWEYYSLRYIIYVLYQMCPEQPSNAGLLFSITPQLLDMTNIGSYWRLYCIDWSINYYIYTHMHRIYIYTSHRYSHHRTRGRTIKNATRIVQVATPPPKIRRKRWNSRGLVQLPPPGFLWVIPWIPPCPFRLGGLYGWRKDVETMVLKKSTYRVGRHSLGDVFDEWIIP